MAQTITSGEAMALPVPFCRRRAARNPLIHSITNYVVAPFQANALSALGASPIMADERKKPPSSPAFQKA